MLPCHRMGSQVEVGEEEEASKAPALDILEVVRYTLQAARRHWLFALVLALPVATLGVLIATYLPPNYEALSAVFVAPEAEAVRYGDPADRKRSEILDPFEGMVERVMRPENLRELAKATNLEKRWMENRPPLLRLKDELTTPLSSLDQEDKERVLQGVLEQRLSVIKEGHTIGFKVQWRDPETAAVIANEARKRYLDEVLSQELAVINARIGIVERELEQASENIESHLKSVEAAYNEANQPVPSGHDAKDSKGAAVVYRRASAPQNTIEPDSSVSQELETIRAEIRRVQDPWEKHLADLRSELRDMLTVLGPKHPNVQRQQRRIEAAAAAAPPELVELRAKEQQLLAEIKAMTEQPADGKLVAVHVGSAQKTGDRQSPYVVKDSATISAEQAKLGRTIDRYNMLTSQLEASRFELMSAKTAFQYRYQVVAVAEPPNKPSKPMLPLAIFFGSLFFAGLVGLCAGAAKELASGKIVETWQAKQLGLPLLAELDMRPQLPREG